MTSDASIITESSVDKTVRPNRFVRVAVDVPVIRLFTYKHPPAFEQAQLFEEDAIQEKANSLPCVGQWVYVPFGRKADQSKLLLGLVVETCSDSDYPEEKCLAWHSTVDVSPLPDDWLELVRFASDFYHYPLGQAIAMAYPMVVRRKWGASSPPKPKPWLKLVVLPTLIEADPAYHRRKRWQRLLAQFIHQPNCVLQTQALREQYPTLWISVKEWQARGWIVGMEDHAQPHEKTVSSVTYELHQEQQAIVNSILDDYAKRQVFAVHLLEGITGSGKTDVYFALAEERLKQDKQVLMLMPEIALTPQMHGRLKHRFPHQTVAVLHSSLSEGARCDAFEKAVSGQARIVVGTRLAVFTPLKQLGMIIIDEEHDASYKQQDLAFSYSARDLAIYRARQHGIPIVLGSATPSLESYWHAIQGRYQLHRLTQRAVNNALLPDIQCINIRGVKLEQGLAPESIQSIGNALERGEQVLVFLNRRGYAPTLFCQACGWLAGCESCSANLVMHTSGCCLRCHHCGYHEPIPKHCLQCGNPDIHFSGYGTQRVEECLAKKFPQATIQRIDRDASRSYKAFSEQQRAIAEGRVNLIIGTQMMAKGHDFPHLSTVVILGADMVLFASDFRGPERLFSLLTQVAGRAGRHQKRGQVWVQTAWLEHPLFHFLRNHDFSGFAAEQLKERQQQHMPPFSHQALLRVESSSLKRATDWLQYHRQTFQHYVPAGVTLYDAIPMRLARKAGWERMQMLVESSSRPALHRFLTQLTEHLYAARVTKDIKWWIDVSPLYI